MPNSDGSSTIISSNSLSRLKNAKNSNSAPVLNGIHEDKELSEVTDSDDAISKVNGVSCTTSTASMTIPMSMKIARKRHSDSEMSGENVKKSKKDCDTPQSEPSPLRTDSLHVPSRPVSPSENKPEANDNQLKVNNGDGNSSEKQDLSDNDSTTSDVIVLDEEHDASCEIEQPRSQNEKETKSDTITSMTMSKSHINNLKAEVKEELEIFCDAKDEKDEASESQKHSSSDERLFLRADVLGLYSERLKRATSTCISLLQRMTQNRTLHNGNWQTKFQNLHNRFLHLKVSTDKLVENSSKDEKQLRSVESQTEGPDVVPLDADPAEVPAGAEVNGVSPHPPQSQRNPPSRHLPVNNPSKPSDASSLPSNTSNHLVNSGVNSDVNSTVSSQSQNLQNSAAAGQNLPVSQSVPKKSIIPHLEQKLPQQQQQQPLQSQQQQQQEQQQTQQQQKQPQQQPQPQQQKPPPPPPPPSQPPPQQQKQKQPQQQPQQQLLVLSQGNQPLQNSHVVAITGSNIIDLTDDDSSTTLVSATAPTARTASILTTSRATHRTGSSIVNDANRVRHPMALPRMTAVGVAHTCCRGLPPPSPHLTVTRTDDGVCLQWSIPNYSTSIYSRIKRYRLFNYSQTQQSVFYSFQNPWKEIGSVDSMDLPMACTLTQIQENSIYYFAIRPVDEYERLGTWSNTATIQMTALNS